MAINEGWVIVVTPPLDTVDFVDSRNHTAGIGRTASVAPITLKTLAVRFKGVLIS